ncbi:MAG: metallophosphoesterase [Cryomorphaceae bacterium]|nr:MAG: metallophosphoesterase [Cryomorphaceae bacterium]
MIISLIVFFLILIFIEFYFYQGIKTILNKRTRLIYIFSFASLYVFFIIYSFTFEISSSSKFFSYYLTLIFLFLISKIITLPIILIEDLIRFFNFLMSKIKMDRKINLKRRAVISKLTLILASIPLPIALDGVLFGRYRYRIINHEIYFKNLPEKFDGYKLTQVSDFHCGSLENKDMVEKAIRMINGEKPDLILFTGDFVNNKYNEIEPWVESFSKLKAKDEMISVLGNHDYGDYQRWSSKKEKEENFKNLLEIQKKIGFKVLLNEHKYIVKDDQKIAIIGVENWGARFNQLGDIEKSIKNVSDKDFKIVMSHDPTHWEKILKDHPKQFDLTLSGHTHGMQFGIEVPGYIKWSPVQWAYKYWAGLYNHGEKYLNVNRGFGVLAFPGRVGIWPEITTITLKRSV